MPYSDRRKVHACSEGSVTFGARLSGALTHGLTHRLIGRARGESTQKKRKKKRDERRSIEYALTALFAGGVTTAGSVQHAACLPPSTWPTRGSDPHPCHPVLSVPRHRHRWRHTTPRQHPHRKKSHVVFRSSHRTRARAHHEPQQSARKEAAWGSWLVHLTTGLLISLLRIY